MKLPEKIQHIIRHQSDFRRRESREFGESEKRMEPLTRAEEKINEILDYLKDLEDRLTK